MLMIFRYSECESVEKKLLPTWRLYDMLQTVILSIITVARLASQTGGSRRFIA